jgi:hypothetical protein
MASTSIDTELEQFTPDNNETRIVEASSTQEESKAYKCLLIFAGFMTMFQVIGINSSYGVFQAYYSSKESFLSPDTPQSAISFVGTLGKPK